MKHANSQQCETIRFDDFCKTNDFHADILWIDVQGAEMMVLEGAHKSLDSIHHIFIEISIWEPTYIEGCTMTEITEKLLKYGFKCIQLGTDSKMELAMHFSPGMGKHHNKKPHDNSALK